MKGQLFLVLYFTITQQDSLQQRLNLLLIKKVFRLGLLAGLLTSGLIMVQVVLNLMEEADLVHLFQVVLAYEYQVEVVVGLVLPLQLVRFN